MTVWQPPPTTFWWPVTAPRPHSSLLVFYEPCRGSPWSCPSRSPGKDRKGSVWNPEAIFSTGVTSNVTDEHCWRHLVEEFYYTPALFYPPPLTQPHLQDLQVTPWSHRCPLTNTYTYGHTVRAENGIFFSHKLIADKSTHTLSDLFWEKGFCEGSWSIPPPMLKPKIKWSLCRNFLISIRCYAGQNIQTKFSVITL